MNPATDRTAIDAAFKPGGEFVRRWAENVALSRVAQSMSKAQLASRADVDASVITRIEKGLTAPGHVVKCQIAFALNMPVDRLFPMPTIERINELYLAEVA